MRKMMLFLFLLMLCDIVIVHAQHFDVENVRSLFGKGKPFKLNGGVNMSTVYSLGNDTGRDPFSYFLTGHINLNIYNQVNLPLAFSLTNAGRSYQLPSPPNKLSLHPVYRWITGHIGDVSMTFSPYTLNGHLFTGAGFEIAPGSVWDCSVMYGRLQKAVEFDRENPSVLPSYKRMGYGAKIGWKKEKAGISLNFFTAKDDNRSLSAASDSLGITPVQNLSGSVQVYLRPLKQMDLRVEYAVSLWTEDIRFPAEKLPGILRLWPASRMSSSCYDALNMQLSYIFSTSRIGIGYERIDPGYKTLGAYYFTSDLENITVNAGQSLCSGKLNLSFNMGCQRDNLSGNKMNATTRWISSANINASFSQKLSAGFSYSNFQTYTNIRPSYEWINQFNLFENADTLRYVQLSQSANLHFNWITRQTDMRYDNLNITCAYQAVADKQGDAVRPGSYSSLMNASTAYQVIFLSSGWSINISGNFCYHTVRDQEILSWGPAIGNQMKFFKKKFNVSNSFSYHSGYLSGVAQNKTFSYRLNACFYTGRHHNVSCSYQYRMVQSPGKEDSSGSLATVGYSYSF